MHKRFVSGAIAIAMLLPALASAQTVSVSADVQAQVQSLLSQIQALQMQLKTLLASSTATMKERMDTMEDRMSPGQKGRMTCIMLNRNLRVGAQGDDVKRLQEILKEENENGFNAEATGFFGPMTARAIAKFQTRMGISPSADGSVGPMTRGFFERACGKGLDGNKGPDEDMRGKIRGEITAVSGMSITVKAGDENSRVVNITGSTTIQIFATATSTPVVGTMADLTVGKKVAAMGTANSDGSLTAVEIKVGMMPPPPPPIMEKIKQIFKFDTRGKMMHDQ